MRLRFFCAHQRSWLEADAETAQNYRMKTYAKAQLARDNGAGELFVQFAGCSLEAAELLIFTHDRVSTCSIQHFTDSACLLREALLELEQPRLAAGVIGGSVARLQELGLQGIQSDTVAEACHRLLNADNTSPRWVANGLEIPFVGAAETHQARSHW